MTDPRRSQAIQAAKDALWRGMPWKYLGDEEQASVIRSLDESWLAEQVVDAVLAVPPEAPRYDVRVASLLDTEVQRLATLAEEKEGPAAERFVRQARYVAGVLDDVVERCEPGPFDEAARAALQASVREPGPNVTEERPGRACRRCGRWFVFAPPCPHCGERNP